MPTRTTPKHLFWLWFAFLLLGVAPVDAGWYTDPQSPEFHWAPTTRATIVSDGLGGAFFAFGSLNDYWQHIGHINAEGEFTFPQGEPPYEYMLPVDALPYTGSVLGTTLVQSEPGTVIAMVERRGGEGYSGFAIAKFDTLGLTGFGRLEFMDADYGLRSSSYDEDYGFTYGFGDGQGGVHLLLASATAAYYNRLDNAGNLTHPWPGLQLPRNGWYPVLRPDGYGGAYPLQVDFASDSVWGLRVDSFGTPQWGEGGRCILAEGQNVWLGRSTLLSPGRLMIWRTEEVVPDSVDHFGYLIDSSGSHVWPEEGVFLECGGPDLIFTVPDLGGGFFFSHMVDLDEGIGRVCHYGSDGNLIAVGDSGSWIDQTDGSGGGYGIDTLDTGWDDGSVQVSYNRYDPSLTLIWNTPSFVVDADGIMWNYDATPDGRGGLIGLISMSQGNALFHLNINGSLGPYSSSRDLPAISPRRLSIISAYPNPFNVTTTIEISGMTGVGEIDLSIYNVLGQKVVTQKLQAFARRVRFVWNAATFASGVYIVKVRSSTQFASTKLLLLK